MADKPHRVQLKRTKGWRIPPNTVKVDRTTVYGNPYQVWNDNGQWTVSRDSCHWEVTDKIAGQAKAVKLFCEHVSTPGPQHHRLGAYPHPSDIRKDLHGKNLACWCALDKPCHADVLLEIANSPEVSP